MLARIQAFFEQHIQLADTGEDESEHALRLAAAALLLEVTTSDHEDVSHEESAAVNTAVQEHFGLTRDETNELIACAEAELTDATDYHQFTSLINRSYSPEQKIHLVEMLWRIAYADNDLHKYEEHLVRKISDLLYVPHTAFIAAKHRANNST